MKNHISSTLLKTGAVISGFVITTSQAFAQDFPKLVTRDDVDPEVVIQSIVTFILGIAGAVAVVYLIWAGIQYIAGGPKGAENAKAQIVNAIIGIAVILLSYVIVNVVIKAISGQA